MTCSGATCSAAEEPNLAPKHVTSQDLSIGGVLRPSLSSPGGNIDVRSTPLRPSDSTLRGSAVTVA
eukprot:7197201-Prymnesium_polylepis.1